MKVYRSLDEFVRLSNAVVTSGTFDGVHKGHQKIITTVNNICKKHHGQSVVITFWPHPRKILNPGQPIKLLSTLEEKIELLRSFGIQHLIIIPFSEAFSNISSDEFIKDILINKIGTKKLVVGYDHRFGKNREGSFEYIKNNEKSLGLEVEEIPREDIDNIGVSSTIIRKALSEGEVEKASVHLGRNYSIAGTVVKGDQIGRTIGYPTANLSLEDEDKLIPSDGIYAVKVLVKDKLYEGMLSIGYRPTVNGKTRTIEVNILNFSNDIYGEKITIIFYKFIRPELKFTSLESLKEEIDNDKKKITGYFNIPNI